MSLFRISNITYKIIQAIISTCTQHNYIRFEERVFQEEILQPEANENLRNIHSNKQDMFADRSPQVLTSMGTSAKCFLLLKKSYLLTDLRTGRKTGSIFASELSTNSSIPLLSDRRSPFGKASCLNSARPMDLCPPALPIPPKAVRAR